MIIREATTVTNVILQADTKNRKVYFKCNYMRDWKFMPGAGATEKDKIALLEYSNKNSIYFKNGNISEPIASPKCVLKVYNDYEQPYHSDDGEGHMHHVVYIEHSRTEKFLPNSGYIEANWTY